MNNNFEKFTDINNSKEDKVKLGAFYTPEEYVKLSQSMLLKRISELKNMNKDYLIIDRAAGTGNLFKGLPKNILNHCVLSTIEPNEHKLLKYYFGKDAIVLPEPYDALSSELLPLDIIQEKIKDPNCAIILYENPPYSEAGGLFFKGVSNNITWRDSYLRIQMKKEVGGVAANDISNIFIWSSFKYYLTKEIDSYIVYSPIKYWKQQNLINKGVIESFICNRKHFNASPGAILCVHWENKNTDISEFNSKALDIKNSKIEFLSDVVIKKVVNSPSKVYDKRKFDSDELNGIICEANGSEFDYSKNRSIKTKPIYNKNVIAYMGSSSYIPDIKHMSFTRCGYFCGGGFFLRDDNYLEKLPIFCSAISFNFFEWYQLGLINKTVDNDSYIYDKDFLKRCFIYSCLSTMNKCKSLLGSDGRLYKNELCFDEGTLATKELDKFELSNEEKRLIELYKNILNNIKGLPEYNPLFSYGTYQIFDEFKDANIKNQINNLKQELKQYYLNNIYNDLFKYELLK